MKKTLIACVLICILFSLQAQEKASSPEVITGRLTRITRALKDFSPADNIPFVKVRDNNGIIGMDENEEKSGPNSEKSGGNNSFVTDPALQKNYPNLPNKSANRAVVQSFDGMGDVGASPADPTLCVGPNHIIQMVNGVSGSMLQVYDKAGNILLPAKNLDAITGKGGLGDPIALYDQLANRFILTEFVNSFEAGSEGLSIAVSQTADPTGAWFVYFFSTGINFPDYPKFSVWNDAYYATSHDFANRTQFIGCSVYAFDRAKMLAGNATATMQRFLIGGGGAERELSMCPVLLQGNNLPPAGTGGLIAYMEDGIWSGSSTDSIGLFEFKVNFTTPSLSTLTTKASLAVDPYIPFVGFNFGFTVSQPGSAVLMDVLQQKVMNQPVYRNFGDHEGIVLTHIVDQGSQIAGVRWYELQKTTANWGIKNQSTFGPDNTYRWTPSICYDAAGNIGLAYNVSSALNNVFPGARYTGRKSCDPLNTMTFAENDIVTGSSSNGGNRWGDYNHMVCDPDGVRFWFTSAYNSTVLWSTRISSFTLDNCLPALCGDPINLAAANITGSTAAVSWTAVANAISYDVELQLAGSGSWTNMITGTTATNFNFTGLGANLTWNWRVRANCAAGAGNFVVGSFSTITPCTEPTDLFSFDVFSNSASVSWIPGLTFTSFSVEYKLNSSATWINAGNTTTTFINITGLIPNSLYNWRVKTNCSTGSSIFATSQFTTAASQVCPSIYDIAPNGSFNTAKPIPFNTEIKGMINPEEDEDYYKFVISASQIISITLTTLPANYDIRLYNSNRSQIAISEKRGVNNELINRRLTPGTYYIKVYGKDEAHSAAGCYTLMVNNIAILTPEVQGNKAVKIFPNPVQKTLHVLIGDLYSNGLIRVYSPEGKLLINKAAVESNTTLDVSNLANGVYLIRVTDHSGNTLYISKFVKE